MVNRRELLQAGAALGVLPLIGLTRASGSPGAPAVTAASALYKVIFDSRFAQGRSFGHAAGRLTDPSRVHPISGDITDIWYNDLHARWHQHPAAVGGLTAYGAIFCLERLAWDAGMRVVFRVDHHPRTDGTFEHIVHGSPQIAATATLALRNAGADWSSRAAQLVAGTQLSAHGTHRAVPLGPSPESGGETPVLMSWLIAPVTRMLIPMMLAAMMLAVVSQTARAADPAATQGKAVFQKWCAPCHGAGADKPGTVALTTLYKGAKPGQLEERTDLTPAIVKQFVRHGVSVMPFFRKTEISDADLDAIAAYLAPPRH